MNKKTCQIFATGEHKDSKGNKRMWTKEDLDQIVRNFEDKKLEVPICCGHPKTNSPAYGWFDTVKRIGDGLYCTFKNVQEEFKTAVNKGLFKNRSISLDENLNLRHLAFLGGQAPAIKGLESFCFEENENDLTFEFSDIDSFEDEKEKKDGKDIMTNTNDTPSAIPAAETTIAELKEKLAAAEQEKADLAKQIEDDKQKAQAKDFEDFCAQAIEAGRLLPKQKDSVMNILTACKSYGSFNFADEEIDAAQLLKGFINSIKQVEFSDIANSDSADETNEENVFNYESLDAVQIAEKIKMLKANSLKDGLELSSEQALAIIKNK